LKLLLFGFAFGCCKTARWLALAGEILHGSTFGAILPIF
jgi:hypothetical protein